MYIYPKFGSIVKSTSQRYSNSKVSPPISRGIKVFDKIQQNSKSWWYWASLFNNILWCPFNGSMKLPIDFHVLPVIRPSLRRPVMNLCIFSEYWKWNSAYSPIWRLVLCPFARYEEGIKFSNKWIFHAVAEYGKRNCTQYSVHGCRIQRMKLSTFAKYGNEPVSIFSTENETKCIHQIQRMQLRVFTEYGDWN